MELYSVSSYLRMYQLAVHRGPTVIYFIKDNLASAKPVTMNNATHHAI